MSRIKDQIYFDYYGYSDEDPTARYNDEEYVPLEYPVGDLYDDDQYWLTNDSKDTSK